MAEEEAAELKTEEAVTKVAVGSTPEAVVTPALSGAGTAIAGSPVSHSSVRIGVSTTHPAMGIL